jgi:hypothetical protein
MDMESHGFELHAPSRSDWRCDQRKLPPFRQVQQEIRAFFERPEAVTLFDTDPYPYVLLPRVCKDLVLPACFHLSGDDAATIPRIP